MNDGLLSVLMFAYNSESRLRQSVLTVLEFFEHEKIPIELIIIDDGSADSSFSKAKRLETEFSKVSAYRLSRNYTTPYAQFAGLSLARGDCAVFCPDDLQRPLDVLLHMYRLWQEGHKLVVAHRASRQDHPLSTFFAKSYYRLMNALSVVSFPPGGADGFLADREIISIIVKRIHPIHTSVVVEVLRLGFDPVYVPYHRPPSKEKSRWTLGKKATLAADTFFACSSFPIKLITALGLFSFLFSIILIIGTVYGKFYGDGSLFGFSIPGWASILIFVSLFSGINLLSLGIIAEYIWRIFEEVKDRPGYVIRNDIDYSAGSESRDNFDCSSAPGIDLGSGESRSDLALKAGDEG